MSMYEDGLWTEATYDHESQHAFEVMANARAESTPLWAFLADAQTEADFHNRLALVEDNIHAVARAVGGEGTPDYTMIVGSLPQQFFTDWHTHHQARLAKAQAANAPRAAERAAQRKQGYRRTAGWSSLGDGSLNLWAPVDPANPDGSGYDCSVAAKGGRFYYGDGGNFYWEVIFLGVGGGERTVASGDTSTEAEAKKAVAETLAEVGHLSEDDLAAEASRKAGDLDSEPGWYVIQRGTMTRSPGGPYASEAEAKAKADEANAKNGTNDYIPSKEGTRKRASYIYEGGKTYDWTYDYDQDYANGEGEDAVILYLIDVDSGEVVDALGGITGDFQITDHGNINASPEFEAYLEDRAKEMAKEPLGAISRKAALSCPKCGADLSADARVFQGPNGGTHPNDGATLTATCPSCGWKGTKRASKTAADQATFDADMARINEALKPWSRDLGDGSMGLDPGAPADLVATYRDLMQYGYANGLMGSYASLRHRTSSGGVPPQYDDSLPNIPRSKQCPRCDGSGIDRSGFSAQPCEACDSTGRTAASVRNPMDPSVMFSMLLDISPEFGNSPVDGGVTVRKALDAWYQDPSTDMYEFAKRWLATPEGQAAISTKQGSRKTASDEKTCQTCSHPVWWNEERKTWVHRGEYGDQGHAVKLSSRKTAGWGFDEWPSVPHPNPLDPGEKVPSCPNCGSINVFLSNIWGPGGRMGDPGAMDTIECRDCGRRDMKPSKPMASRRTAAIPSGRSDYQPGRGLVGSPSPQSDPDQFSSEDLVAEIKYLIDLNRRFGSNPLRTAAYMKLMAILDDRGYHSKAGHRTAAEEPPNIALCRKVLTEGFYAGGEQIDQFSASAIVQVYDALQDPANKAKFGNMPLHQMADIAFKLAKGASRTTGSISTCKFCLHDIHQAGGDWVDGGGGTTCTRVPPGGNPGAQWNDWVTAPDGQKHQPQERMASRRTAEDQNAWPPKQDSEKGGTIRPDNDPSAVKAPQDGEQDPTAPQPPQEAAQGPGVPVETVAQGDVLLDAADGTVATYEVHNVVDEGETILLTVTKDGGEQMDLRIPKAEQVQTFPKKGDESQPPPEGDKPPAEDQPPADDAKPPEDKPEDDKDKKKPPFPPKGGSLLDLVADKVARNLLANGYTDDNPYGQANPYTQADPYGTADAPSDSTFQPMPPSEDASATMTPEEVPAQ